MAHLAAAGFRPLLLDWGTPEGRELGFTLDEQIHGRAQGALDVAIEATGQRPVLIGYCLGGLLAAGLAASRQRDLAGMALLATPWDFHAAEAGAPPLLAATPQLTAAIAALGCAPVDLLQGFFASLDPLAVIAKYARFADLPPDHPKARAFVAVEDWLNDGVPLAGPVAQECLLDWYGANLPGRGLWAPGGIAVVPERLDLPAFVAVPQHDRIVPTASAEAIVPLCDMQRWRGPRRGMSAWWSATPPSASCGDRSSSGCGESRLGARQQPCQQHRPPPDPTCGAPAPLPPGPSAVRVGRAHHSLGGIPDDRRRDRQRHADACRLVQRRLEHRARPTISARR